MKKLSGHTQPFAVLGHPIGHTLSPVMHNCNFEALGMDAIYLAFDVAPGALMDVLPSMQAMGFEGVNLTVPLKEVAFRGLDRLDASAQRMGAVNTVEFEEGATVGHNTDGYGFLRALDEAFGAGVRGVTVFVLGCGGAGRAVALTCAAEGAGRLLLTDVDEERTRRLEAEISALPEAAAPVDVVPADPRHWPHASLEADLVIQCTPVGMKREDVPLLKREAFRADQMLFDLVYMYPQTGIMRQAEKAGARTANGLGMLLHQGARAFTIWTGREAAVEDMRRVLESEVYG